MISYWNDSIYRNSPPNTGKYGPGKTPCFDTFHAVAVLRKHAEAL